MTNLKNYSKSITLDLVDQVYSDHDIDVIEMKTKTEEMWQKCSSKRERKSLAARDVPGTSFFGDNIGKFQSWQPGPTLVTSPWSITS